VGARTWVFGAILLAVAGAIFYTTRYFDYAGGHPTTDDAYVQGDTSIVSAKVFGRVGRVWVRGYQHVRKGQPLVQLDDVDARIAVEQAQASLDAAQTKVQQAAAALVAQRDQAAAAYAQAQAAQAAADVHVPQSRTNVTLQDQTTRQGIAMAQSQLSSAVAQVNSARSALDKARNDLTRAKELFAQGAIAAQEVDQAQAAYDNAVAQNQSAADAVNHAQASLAQAKATQLEVPLSQFDVATAVAQKDQAAAGLAAARAGFDVVAQRQADLATAQAGVAQAQAQLHAARQQLDYTTIVAPADGLVASDVPLQPGQVVQPGQTLLTLVFSTRKWVEANFKETQLARVQVGQPVTVRVDLLGRSFTGRVERLGPATGSALSVLPAQNATGNFTKVVQRVPVRIALDDAPADLAIGLSVEATVDTTGRTTAARHPSGTVRR
jgi:membrane fusion protein (multidrug efflux system)